MEASRLTRDDLVYPSERVWFGAMVLVSVLIGAGLGMLTLSSFAAASVVQVNRVPLALLVLFTHAVAVGRVRGNGVRVSEHLRPFLHPPANEHRRRLGLASRPAGHVTALAVVGIVHCATGRVCVAQADSIVGTWTGTSTCVDRAHFPGCNDEIVVYEITRHHGAPDSVHVRADKVVDGVRDPMGEFDFASVAPGQWVASVQVPRGRLRIVLQVSGRVMTGSLTDVATGRQVRRIALQRATPVPTGSPDQRPRLPDRGVPAARSPDPGPGPTVEATTPGTRWEGIP